MDSETCDSNKFTAAAPAALGFTPYGLLDLATQRLVQRPGAGALPGGSVRNKVPPAPVGPTESETQCFNKLSQISDS